ncbi:hypothetical protein BC830DRAFT_1174529 [Chytriomyces sp. MP71]|nr:hypothetical protein BC830DRAFT_1174529 [Chytriomyces sp. MP71]
MNTEKQQAIPSWRAPSNSCDYSLCSRISFAIQTLGAVAVLVSTSPVAQGYPKPLCATGRISKCSVKEQANAIASVPVMTLSQSASWEFTQRALDARVVSNVSLSANTRYEIIGVDNILAETPGGNPNSIVLFGSHLDSIRGGPGVNDDGSGAMATLELAYALSSSSAINKTVQKVRFAWWTAEEIGLIGSTYHVEQLFAKDPVELAKYKLNIDTDMIASPNYVRGVWDGRNVPDERIRAAGAAIQSVFERFFAKRGLATVPFAFNGRSDFAPFMRRGIPAGGVITGEDEIKSAHEAELFGGVAGMVLDPNYHQPTDTVESLRGPGRAVLEQNLEALANALGVFAFHKDLDAFLRGGR